MASTNATGSEFACHSPSHHLLEFAPFQLMAPRRSVLLLAAALAAGAPPLVNGVPVQPALPRERGLVVAVRSRASQADFDFAWSARLGRPHLSLEEVCASFGPATSSVTAVRQWAALHGATRVEATRCTTRRPRTRSRRTSRACAPRA